MFGEPVLPPGQKDHGEEYHSDSGGGNSYSENWQEPWRTDQSETQKEADEKKEAEPDPGGKGPVSCGTLIDGPLKSQRCGDGQRRPGWQNVVG